MQQPVSNESQETYFQTKQESAKDSTSRSRGHRTFLTVLKILVGLGLLILSLRGIQYENLVAGIRSANIPWLVVSICSVCFGLVLKLWRWGMLVRNYHIRVSLARLFSAYFVGQATNIILPLRGGELVRLGYFADDKTILPGALSTILLEKYLDLVALTVCGLLISVKISLDNILNMDSWLLPLTIGVTIILLLAIFLGPAWWGKIRTKKFLPQSLTLWLDNWVQASQWLRNPVQVIPSVLLTILIWVVMWVTNLFLFKSLGLPVGITAGGLVLVLVYIGLFPALMPGNIGPFYFFARLALIPFSILQDQAITFAVVLHAIVTLPPLLAGLIGIIIHSHPPVRA